MRSSRRGLISLVLILTWANLTFAITLNEYREHVKKAIGALELIREPDESTPPQREASIALHVRNARAALPVQEGVEWNGTKMTADNSWLDNELKEFEKLPASDTARTLVLDRILERLKALEQRLDEIDKAARSAPASKDEMKERLATVLQRAEYSKTYEGESAFSRLKRRISRMLSNLFPKRTPSSPGAAHLISQLSAILAVVLAIGAIVYALRFLAPRLLRNRRVKKDKDRARIVLGESLEPNQSAADLLAEAEALARAGDLRGAIRRGYIALLVELADRKIVSLAQHKTNRDYLRGLRGIENLYRGMEALTNKFELHWYGLVPADEGDWAAFRAGYKEVSSSEFRVSS